MPEQQRFCHHDAQATRAQEFQAPARHSLSSSVATSAAAASAEQRRRRGLSPSPSRETPPKGGACAKAFAPLVRFEP